MSCAPFDLRDYFLKELPDSERGQVETHVRACQACRLELDRLRLTETTLFALRDEEIPQRIAFVSDKVFEASLWQRGWAALWGSSGRLGFVSAAMLSTAILISALTRPAPIAAPGPAPSPVGTVAEADIRHRVDTAVEQAVKDVEAKYAIRTDQLVRDIERHYAQERKLDLAAFEKDYDYLQRKTQVASRGDYAADIHELRGQQ